MVSMLSYPRLFGSPVIRSMATWENGGLSLGTVILYRGAFVQCMRFLFCWQIAHPLTYCSIQVHPPGQQKRSHLGLGELPVHHGRRARCVVRLPRLVGLSPFGPRLAIGRGRPSTHELPSS